MAFGLCGIALQSLWDVSEELRTGKLMRVLPDHQGSQDFGIHAVHGSMPAVHAHLTTFAKALADYLHSGAAFG